MHRAFSVVPVLLVSMIGGAAAPPVRTPTDLTIIALLENNILISFDLLTGTELHRITLPGDSAYPHPFQYLGHDVARKRLIILTGDRGGVVAVDLPTFSVAARSEPVGGFFRTVAVGAVTGSPYLIGDSGAVLRVVKLDSDLERTRSSWRYQLDSDVDGWFVHDAGVSAREDRIIVSYHGVMTTGIDWFGISGDSLTRCKQRKFRQHGCLPGHGSFVQSNTTIFAATGQRWIVRIDGDSAVSFDTTLDQRNHVMEIALDPTTQRIVAIDNCHVSTSSAVVDLRSTPRRWPPAIHGLLATSQSAPTVLTETLALRFAMCGERVDALDGYVVIAHDNVVQVLESASGRVVSTIPTARKIVDLMLVRKE